MSKTKIMKPVILIVLAVLTVLFFSSGGALADQWLKTYGGAGNDKASAVQQTTDAGYILAGSTDSFGAGSLDIWVLKLDISGNIEWQKTYGGSGDDEASSIQQTVDGGYIVAGYTTSFGAGKKDVWILKLDKDGNVQWQNTYGGTEDDEAFSIQQTADGGYVVAGYTSSFGAGEMDVWVLKLHNDGQVEWQNSYGGSGNDVAYAIQQTSDGGYIVAGSTDSFGKGMRDMWVLKLDEGGNVDWQKTYGEIGDDEANSVQQTSDGGYIVAGWTNSYSATVKPWILKLDSDGVIQSQLVLDASGAGDDKIYSIRQTSDGGYVLAGSTDSYGLGKKDTWIIKFYPDGTMHQTLFGGTDDDEAFSIQETMDHGYAVAGWTHSFGAGNYDAWAFKLDSKLDITGCSVIGNSFASAANTQISGVGTSSTPQDTGALPQASSVTPGNTQVTPGTIDSCTAEGPDISVEPPLIDFGSVVMGTLSSQTLAVMNVGSKDLVIGNLSIPALTGTNPQDFGIRSDGCSGQTLKSLSTCTVALGFQPSADGQETAVLSIPSNDTDFGNLSVVLQGVGTPPISLTAPPNHTSFSGCSLYQLPTFSWDVSGSFKSYQILFSKSTDPNTSTVKVKTTPNNVVMKSNTWKQVMLVPGGIAGPVYWWVLGIYSGGKTGFLTIPSVISIEPAESVKNAQIASTSAASVPILSWDNNCNVKFKVWFGKDEQFSKSYTVSPRAIKNPLDNDGKSSITLTSRQWGSVQKLVGAQSGATVFWKVESWDGATRESQTSPPMTFILSD